jgi:predicted enzyme related to lactoylglutathione lyase
LSELKIVTPVSRFLGAADQAQTMAFYRDVLGFDVRQSDTEPQALEVHSGPARILFGPHESGPEGQDDPHPGPAVVFFEINNVEGFHTDVRTRGGNPSSLQHVNGIKMRVFEVRDPDGHTLWFGQAFLEPEKPPPPGLLEKIMPEFPLSDVPSGVEYYRNALGFSVNYEQADLAVMDRDDVRLLLVARTERHKGIGSAYVYVHDADELHAKLRRHGARVQGAPISQPWGLREFRVLDVEGNQITFGQPFE